MIAFWISAAGLSAAAGALMLRGAARAGATEGVSTDLDAHKRQLGEIDRLAEAGLLDEAERKAARAEAGRRLLVAADTVLAVWAEPLADAGAEIDADTHPRRSIEQEARRRAPTGGR